MLKKFLLLASLIPTLAFGHGAPVIWNGTNAKWLPSGLNSAGVCKLSSSGVMTSGTVDDTQLTDDYILADGSRGLTSNWNAGAHNITASTFIGALTGNASTASALAANPSDCAAGTVAVAIAANGNLTCAAVTLTSDVTGALPMANGGTNKNMTASAGAVVYSDADSFELSAVGTSGQAMVSGGTGAPTWYAPTAGSVIFAGTGGILDEDNSKFFYDKANDRVGIGTATPSYRFHVEVSADDYSQGMALSHALGGANSLWRFYPDLNGTLSIYNPNQGTEAWQISATVQQLRLAAGGEDGGAVNIRNQTGQTGHHTLVLRKLGSQTGDAIRYYDTDVSTVLAKVDVAGAGTFAGMTVSTLGTGIAHLNSSGVMSSSAVGLASADVTGTLPVGNGGTGQTSYTDGQLLIGNSSGNTLTKSTLTAGTGITITNGGGSITIASSGGSGSALSVAAKTADYTMTNSDDVILCNPTTGSVVTITMHSAVSATTKSYRVKNVGFGDCNVNTNGTDKFDRVTGETSASIPAGGLPTSGFSLIPDSGGLSWLMF